MGITPAEALKLLRAQRAQSVAPCVCCSPRSASILNPILDAVIEAEELTTLPSVFAVFRALYEREHGTPLPIRSVSTLRFHLVNHDPERFTRLNLIRRGPTHGD